MRQNRFKHVYFFGRRGGGRKSTPEGNAAAILDKIAQSSKADENLSRARRTIRDLILCNQFDYFCTFTFNHEKVDRYNFAACKKKITEVFKNYKTRYSPDFRYLIVPEFHKDGGLHFHGLVRGLHPGSLTVPGQVYKRNRQNGKLELVPNTKGYADWSYYSKKLGFFSCSRIKDYEKCARYVSKYITKDLVNLALGQRVFMSSSNLNRPELVFDCDDVPRMFGHADFENEFVAVKESPDSLGILPDYWGEQCSELRDPLDGSGPLLEKDIFFPRLTGTQLSLYSFMKG